MTTVSMTVVSGGVMTTVSMTVVSGGVMTTVSMTARTVTVSVSAAVAPWASVALKMSVERPEVSALAAMVAR